jgi:hypothetical protein
MKLLIHENLWKFVMYIPPTRHEDERIWMKTINLRKIKEANTFQRIIHYIIIKSVQLELIRLRYMYLFTIINYLVGILLVFNNSYFFSLFIAIILFLSRFNFLMWKET